MHRSRNALLQELAERYREAGEEWPATKRMVAAWAIRNKLWKPKPRSMIDLLANELGVALREDYYDDPQGRRVRKKHAIRSLRQLSDGTVEQLVFWVDIEDATEKQMHTAFQQRRQQVLRDCCQLHTDVSSYNDNNRHGANIQMVFDFTEDIEELLQPKTYPGGR